MRLTPQQVFRIDGAGALLTASIIGIVIPRLPAYFQMPADVLTILALVACCFAIYSLVCSVLKPTNWPVFLKGIATANVTYCIATVILLMVFRNKLGLLDFTYFIGEITIVVGLAVFEWKFASSNEHA